MQVQKENAQLYVLLAMLGALWAGWVMGLNASNKPQQEWAEFIRKHCTARSWMPKEMSGHSADRVLWQCDNGKSYWRDR